MLLENLLKDFEIMEEVFNLGYEYPRIQLHSNKDNLLLLAEVPGISERELKISVSEDVVTISVQKEKAKHEDKSLKILRSEIRNDNFSRKIELPFEVEEDKIKAHLKNGLLSIILPIKEQDKPKIIKIEGE